MHSGGKEAAGQAESPIAILADEHEVILRGLDVLEQGLARVEEGAAVDSAFFGELVGFFRDFADRRHHGKEEAILFERMAEELDYPRQGGPIAVLSSEHEAGRAHVRAIADAADRLAGDPAAARELVSEGRAYIALLRAHIEREDHTVFPTVEDFLGAEERADLLAAFSRFEAAEGGPGNRASCAALLERLAR